MNLLSVLNTRELYTQRSMERHDISILILVAVIAMAFPILYRAQANENTTPLVVYKVSALAERSRSNEVIVKQPTPTRESWNIAAQQDEELVDSVPEYVEETILPEPEQVESPVFVQAINVTEPALVTIEEKNDGPDTEFAETILREIQRLTERVRKHEDLRVLKDSSSLTSIALGHSVDMITYDYFAHTAPNGCTLTCRFENAAYSATTWGENIAYIEGDHMPGAKEVAQSFFEKWMESKGHRENILSEEYTHQGIGVIVQGDAVYVTVNFAKPL